MASSEQQAILNAVGGAQGSFESAYYIKNVQVSIDNLVEMLQREAIRRNNIGVDYLKGFLAEQWHAGTYNTRAAVKQNSQAWADVPGDNTPGQDVRYSDGNQIHHAELKTYKTANDTAKAISRPEYSNSEKIGPSDQVDSIRETSSRHAKSNAKTRPEQAANYQHTADNVKNHIESGGASSKPLSHDDAKELAKDLKKDPNSLDRGKYGLNTENFIEWKDIIRQSGSAAIHAAILSASITAVPQIYMFIRKLVEDGEIDPAMLGEAGSQILLRSGETALRAGMASMMTGTMKSGLLGNSLKCVSPVAVGMATTLALNSISYSIQCYQAKMQSHEMAMNCIRDSFILLSGYGGATVGQLLIPIPVFGALIGNLVGSVLGAAIYGKSQDIMLAVCKDTGWTMWGLVKQDYTVPEDILIESGWATFPTNTFETSSFPTQTFSTSSFETNTIGFRPIRRGVIAPFTIGNL